MNRHAWRFDEVSDISGAAAALRTYIEQRDVRRCLTAATADRPIRSAADVGCGYGRLTPVLSEFAQRVAGFEREEQLLAAARALQPAIAWTAVPDLASLPATDGSFDFAMTFTVLQHVPEEEARRILRELRRIADGGFVLLVEETDSSLGAEPAPGWSGGLTVGRPVATWEAWMAPWRLTSSFARTIEPGYARADVGTYMLFRG